MQNPLQNYATKRLVANSLQIVPAVRKSALVGWMIALGIPVSPGARAASASWLGTASGDWVDDTNWTAAHPDAPADVATFNGESAYTTISVGTRALGKILFTGSTTPGYSLGGGTITFGNGIIVEVQASVVAPQTIACNFDLGGTGSNNPEIRNHSVSCRLTLAGNFTSLVAGTRSMTIGGNSTAAVTECSGNFTAPTGLIQMQVQKGTGIFSGASTFSNLNVTDANNLLINGTTASSNPVVINNSGLLGGTGSINARVNVLGSVASPRTGPVIAPGDFTAAEGSSTGSLSVSGIFEVGNRDAPADFRFELGGSAPGDGAGVYDQLNVGGSVLLGLNNAGTVPNSKLSLSLVNGNIPANGAVYYILSRGDAGAFGARTFANLPEGASVELGNGYMGTITYQANWQGSQSSSSPTGGNDIAILAAGANLALPSLEVTIIEPGDVNSGAKLSGFLTGGTPNSSARIEASSDLGISDPWQTVGTVTLDFNGEAPVTGLEDPGSAGAAKSFFRIAVP